MSYFNWLTGVKGRLSFLEEAAGEENASGSARNCLVAYTTVELEEEVKNKVEKVVRKASNYLNELARELCAEAVVVFPFAHFPVELASPHASFNGLRQLAAELTALSNGDYAVLRAPFGSHKIREGRILGHPKAVLLRKFRV